MTRKPTLTRSRKGVLFAVAGLALLPAIGTAGTGMQSWSDTTVGSYQDYEPARSYLHYTDTYPGNYASIQVEGTADAANQSLGASIDVPSDWGNNGRYGGIGMMFNGRLRVDMTGSYLTSSDPIDFRLGLRLSGTITNDALVNQYGTFLSSYNSGEMVAAYVIYEGNGPLELTPTQNLYNLAVDVESRSFPPDIQPLATFFGEARTSRNESGYQQERYTYEWSWWGESNRNSMGAQSNNSPLTTIPSDTPFEAVFDSGNVILDFTAIPQNELWVMGLLMVDGMADDQTSAAIDFMNGFSANITSLTPGVTVDVSANVAAVPLPAAAWLFGSGLLLLLRIGKRS